LNPPIEVAFAKAAALKDAADAEQHRFRKKYGSLHREDKP
jgi:hypothetical protein